MIFDVCFYLQPCDSNTQSPNSAAISHAQPFDQETLAHEKLHMCDLKAQIVSPAFKKKLCVLPLESKSFSKVLCSDFEIKVMFDDKRDFRPEDNRK
ncbi:MAG TPA: hypothetical protein VIJ01_06550 [Candidatus Angelobacter sp.]